MPPSRRGLSAFSVMDHSIDLRPCPNSFWLKQFLQIRLGCCSFLLLPKLASHAEILHMHRLQPSRLWQEMERRRLLRQQGADSRHLRALWRLQHLHVRVLLHIPVQVHGDVFCGASTATTSSSSIRPSGSASPTATITAVSAANQSAVSTSQC